MKAMVRALAGAAMFALAAGSVHAQNLITNGNFETGDFTGWTANVQAGSGGNLFIGSGNGSPQNGFPVSTNPNGGNFYAVSDQGGPGSYSLTQAFTVGSGNVHVSFDLYDYNQAGVILPGRDFTSGSVQNVEVDILKGGADAFSNDPNDIVAVLFGPGGDFTPGNPWQTISADLSLAGGTYQFRFAETDNQLFNTGAIDNVSVTGGAVPEPASWALMLGGFGLVGGAMRRRRVAVSFA